ncbi:Medium-chain acyl-CoA ligase ACSF2, mitochondrial [Anthophora plagiata]
MLRSCIIRNSSLLPLCTSVRINHQNVCTMENTFLVPAWKLRNISVQHRGFSDEIQKDLSYMKNGGHIPLVEDTIGKLLGEAAERWPDKEYVVSINQDLRLTFKDVLRRADRLAAGLFKLGMKRNDCLGIWGPNDVEWLITFMCAARAGFILATINPTYQLDEMVYCIQKINMRAVISPYDFKMQNYPLILLEARRRCPSLEHIIIYSKDHVTGTRRFKDVEEIASRSEVERIAAEQDQISCHDGNNIQFTSGTTGRPKATLLSHRSVVNNSKQGAWRSELTAEHRICVNVPFFHAFGVIKGLLCTLHSGSKLVLPSRSFNPVKSLEAIIREKCNVVYGTPTMWIHLLDAQQQLQPPPITLFSGVTGGSPASPELIRMIKEHFHFDNIKMIYGLTETTAIIFHSLPNEHSELTETTVGHVTNHIEVMVVDENEKLVPFGKPGELWVRGYSTMKGYWGDEESTKKTMTEDGWLKTGDQFILLANGYGKIVGRLKDMIIRGGENIFPKEIEDMLMTHPSVLEAQVIGAYDKVYGEEVCACVRLRDGRRLSKEELREYCKGRMAPFKIPRYVEIVDEYPKTASGKIQKYLLKKKMEEEGVIPSN